MSKDDLRKRKNEQTMSRTTRTMILRVYRSAYPRAKDIAILREYEVEGETMFDVRIIHEDDRIDDRQFQF